MTNTYVAAGGFLVAGVVLGIVLGVRLTWWVERVTHGWRAGTGACSFCGTQGYLVGCKRCGKQIAMCHYYSVLYPDDPGPKMLRKRRSAQVCTKCVSADVRDSLEAM